MKNIQLSNQQIEALFKFTEKKSVKWYDLQVELVDHLACKIEEEMETHDHLSFELALEKVYKSFGIFGFSHVIQEKTEQLYRQGKKIWWHELKSYVKFPRIAMTLCLFLCLWQIAELVTYEAQTMLWSVYVMLYIISEVILWRQLYKMKKGAKKLLLLESGVAYRSGWISIYHMGVLGLNDSLSPVVFALLAVIGLIVRLADQHLYKQMRNKAREMYPQAFSLA